jgi:two-component system sensor histidine kinase PilS (NtrC family)
MHSSGGIYSGMGALLIISVAGISLLSPGIVALLYAAVASLALLGDQVYGYWIQSYEQPAYIPTGILGATLFGIALLASRLALAARKSEKLAEQRGIDLANLSELNEQIIEHMQTGVIVIDDEGKVQLVNQTAWTLLGEPGTGSISLLPETAPELIQAYTTWLEDQSESNPVIRLDNNQELQLRFSKLSGPGKLNNLIYLEDTAERKRIAQDLKLASLGRLTASIAHEIRNPLGAISHAAQLLDENPQIDQADSRLVHIILDHSKRMNAVIQNILGLSRKGPTHPENIELKSWLENFVTEFSQHHGFPAERINISIDPEDATASFDPNQLHQVLWNLCTNAKRYACTTDEACLMIQGGIDREVPFLDVIDNGPGIDPELQEKLFEPFVTTTSQGVGLGLYISREMCENNGAALEYIGMPMGGSCFRIQFARNRRIE